MWIKISAYGRFQPDFLTPIGTLFFKGIRENVKYSAPGENYFVILVVLFTFGACSKIAELFLKWFPGIANLPDSATGVVGILGFAAFLFGLFTFLRESKPDKGSVSEKTGLSRRTIIMLIPTALVIIVLILAFTPLGTRFYGEMLDIIGEDRRIVLRALEHGDLRRVFEMLLHVYQDAYDVKLPDGELRSMLFERVKTGMYERAENLRFFIRSLVEAMDLMRFYPDVPPEQLLDFN